MAPAPIAEDQGIVEDCQEYEAGVSAIDAEHLRILRWYAWRFACPAWPRDDLLHEGILAYLACRDEDGEPTHWVAAARYHILTCRSASAQQWHYRRVPEQSLSVALWPPELYVLAAERAVHFAAALAALSARERTIVHLYYEEEQTLQAIGAVLGLHHSSVSRLLQQACVHLRASLRLDAPEALQASHSTCRYGHPLTPDNIYTCPTPVRTGYIQQQCKTCRRIRRRQRYRATHAHKERRGDGDTQSHGPLA